MENKELCKQCGGRCCKTCGCHYSPEDFKDLTFEGLKREIDKGFISIDWWEGNPFEDDRNIFRGLFLRIRNINSPIVDASWGGRCILLTDTGCPVSYEERPKGARLLIPSEEGCRLEYDKRDCAKDWYKYRDILSKLYDEYI